MKIVQGKPPIWDKAKRLFGDAVNEKTVFTYGDTIYCQTSTKLDLDLLAHEEVHRAQQGKDPDVWWEKWFTDRSFRKQQELQAYKVQFEVYKRFKKDRNQQARYATALAGVMAGPMYGKVCDFSEAFKAIKGL